MRPRFPLPLFILVCLSLPATAFAATRCSGLSVSVPAGSHAQLSSADGRALHMQLAGDGADAVSVALSHLSGATLSCTQPWPSSSSMSLSLDFITAASVVTPSADCRVDLQHSSTGFIDISVDVSSMCSSGTCSNLYRVCYSVDGGVVWTEQATPASSFTLSDAPGGHAAIPSVSMEMEQTRDILAMKFDSPVEYHTPSSTVLVDRVVTVMELASPDGDPIPDIDRCVISCPVTGGASSLEFSSLSCVRDGTTLTAADVNLDGQPDLVRLDASSSTTAVSVTTTATWSRMVFGGGGSGGCAGGQCSPLSVLDQSCPATTLQLSRKDMLQWTAVSDEHAQCDFTIQARDQFGNARVASSLECRMVGPSVVVSSSLLGQPADSVRVLSHGSEVGRFAICAACGSSVSVSAPPGGPPVMAFAAMGAVHGGWDIKENKKAIVTGDRVPDASSSTTSTCTGGMMLGFCDPRVIDVGGGVSVTGDELQFKSSCSPGGGETLTIYGSNFSMQRSGTPSPASSVLEVTDFSSSHADQVVASVVGPTALSTTNPTVDVALDLQREDHSPARGLSVTVHLSSNLVLLGNDEMDLFSSHGQTEFFRTFDGLSYTFDVAILGPGCGPSDDGRAFMLHVARAPGAPDGLAFVTVTHTELASCNGPALPCDAGSKTAIVLDSSTPSAATTLTAQTLQVGNDADGTAKIVLDWTLTDPTSQSVELYRAPYGDYPRYASGSSPALPASYPPPAPWTPVALSCSSGSAGTVSVCTDEPSSRDCYTYSAVVVSRSGNRSPFVMTPSCALDYHLGDVTNGVTQCSGDNQVTTADISDLGSHYGAGVPLGSPFDCLDVGPTLDRTVSSRPVPDHKLSFFDLILYAIDFSVVSTPADTHRPLAASANALSLDVPRLPAVGQTFEVGLRMSGAGDVQGLSATLAFDPAVVEQVGVSEGDLMSRQGRAGVVLSAGPGDVDAALLGAGTGFAGEGELARVTFRVKATGDPALSLAGIVARDLQNRDLTIAGSAPGAFAGTTALRMAFPNPFERTTTVVFSLHQTGPADVSVYDVAGRHVRSLLRGVQPAGEHTLSWDGRDDGGGPLGPGVYMLRLDTGGHRETRVLRLVK